jgi:hypothetical protein
LIANHAGRKLDARVTAVRIGSLIIGPVIGAAPERLFCVQVTLGQAAAGTPGPGAGHRSGQASDRFRGSREGRIAGGREPPPASLDELDLVRW